MAVLDSGRRGAAGTPSDIVAHVLDVATVTGRAADQALKIASRLLDGRQAAARGLSRSVALEVARADAADLTEGLRCQALRILQLAESLDAELGPGLPAYRVTGVEPAGIPAPDRRELAPAVPPAPPVPPPPTVGDARRTRRRRLLIGRGATLAG